MGERWSGGKTIIFFLILRNSFYSCGGCHMTYVEGMEKGGSGVGD